MEAIDFLKEAKRKCSSTTCGECHIERLGVMCVLLAWSDEKLEQLVSEVEKWSKEHPAITNASKFKEVFGEKRLSNLIGCKIRNASGEEIIVDMQKTEWWNEPYKEPEHED